MAQNLTALVSDNGNCSDTTAATSVVNFKPKDTNGWKDYKKLKTYLILKEQQNEKVTTRVGNKEIMPYYLVEKGDMYGDLCIKSTVPLLNLALPYLFDIKKVPSECFISYTGQCRTYSEYVFMLFAVPVCLIADYFNFNKESGLKRFQFSVN